MGWHSINGWANSSCLPASSGYCFSAFLYYCWFSPGTSIDGHGRYLMANFTTSQATRSSQQKPWLGWKKTTDISPLSSNNLFDAIFVMGGSLSLNPLRKPQLNLGGERIGLAARMYLQKRTSYLVTSGGSDISIVTRKYWRDLKIPDEHILSNPKGFYSKAEIRSYPKLIRRHRWKRVGLITSAWHLRRVMKLCKRANISIHPLPADFMGRYRGKYSPQHWIPFWRRILCLTHLCMGNRWRTRRPITPFKHQTYLLNLLFRLFLISPPLFKA